jgi:hypothetical protein
MERINDFDVLDVRYSVPIIAKMFPVVLEAFIMLLFDGFQSFNTGRMLVCALEVANEHGT